MLSSMVREVVDKLTGSDSQTGEFYEYEELRASMIKKQGYAFKGHSDSELVIAL